ncbi:MAG TPA: cation acetate symporter [Streptosporangiaceae bacterium]|jgi:cation/acetate symporter|nr:cation acetate symporter [Streptosporangiaceae bacterium]
MTSAMSAGVAAASHPVGRPIVNIAIFAFFVTVTLVIAIRVAGTNKTTADYYAGGRVFSGRQNGIAIGGDYLSAASFLGIAGAIALYGYDGFLYSIGFLVAWLVVLLLVAEPLRNTGRYTMADVLYFRFREKPVRAAAAISTLTVSSFYLLAQMAAAGGLVNLLLGVTTSGGQDLTIAVVGLLMIFYVLVGGMRGTTWVQIVKAIILTAGAAVTTCWVLAKTGFDVSGLLRHAAAASPAGSAVLGPGLEYGANTVSKLDFISLSLALVLGTAGLPHVLTRLYTVPDAIAARRSVIWAVWLVGLFYLFTLVLGFGAMWLVGAKRIEAAPGKADSAVPLLAYHLGGTLLLGVVAAVAFATILAVVAGLTITASASFAHDVYAGLLRSGDVEPGQEIRVARITAIVVGLIAVAGGTLAKNIDVAFLVALAFAVAASANLPSIVFSLFWPRFTSRGALWSIYGGLISAVALIIFSPVVSGQTNPASGAALSVITDPRIDFAFFPLNNPGIVSIPLAFFLGWLGSITDRRAGDAARFARVQVCALSGIGAERSGPATDTAVAAASAKVTGDPEGGRHDQQRDRGSADIFHAARPGGAEHHPLLGRPADEPG